MAETERHSRSEERAARNEVEFRRANEALEEKREELRLEGSTPFLCECGDEGCTELIPLSLDEYEHVRSHPTWFLTAERHDTGDAEVVEQHGAYVIVEKYGIAGRIAAEENPRG